MRPGTFEWFWVILCLLFNLSQSSLWVSMGAALQTLGVAEVASEVACCAGSAACSLFCKKKVGGIRSRLYFTVFLLLGTVLCLVMLSPNMRLYLDKIPFLCTRLASQRTCDNFVGYGAVYRVSIAMSMFFLLFSFLTYNVRRVIQRSWPKFFFY